MVTACGLGFGFGLGFGLALWCVLALWGFVLCTAGAALTFGAVVCELAEDPQPASARASATAPNDELLSPFFSISLNHDAADGESFLQYCRPVHVGQLTAPEQRVLGALIEKRWTTPDQYPLSLNALRLACNQLTNRDPVTGYDEATVREAAQRLSRYGLARLASGHGSRAAKYRHLAEDALSLGREELAVLAVLLLRGPQTPGEIKARTERMASFGSVGDVQAVLDGLAGREYARSLGRRPGQKEDRFEQLLGGQGEADGVVGADAAGTRAPVPAPVPQAADSPAPADGSADNGSLAARVAALESQVGELRKQVSELLAG